MSRLDHLHKDQEFLKAVDLAFLEFSNRYGVTSSKYFAEKLKYNTPNEFQNHLQPYNNKFLKIDEFFIILTHLGDHRKILLDFICNKYDYICSKKAQYDSKNTDYKNIKETLLDIAGSNGSIFNDYVNFTSDNELDKKEIEQLIKASYQTRALLNEFEDMLKEVLKNETL